MIKVTNSAGREIFINPIHIETVMETTDDTNAYSTIVSLRGNQTIRVKEEAEAVASNAYETLKAMGRG